MLPAHPQLLLFQNAELAESNREIFPVRSQQVATGHSKLSESNREIFPVRSQPENAA